MKKCIIDAISRQVFIETPAFSVFSMLSADPYHHLHVTTEVDHKKASVIQGITRHYWCRSVELLMMFHRRDGSFQAQPIWWQRFLVWCWGKRLYLHLVTGSWFKCRHHQCQVNSTPIDLNAFFVLRVCFDQNKAASTSNFRQKPRQAHMETKAPNVFSIIIIWFSKVSANLIIILTRI